MPPTMIKISVAVTIDADRGRDGEAGTLKFLKNLVIKMQQTQK